MKLGRTIGYVLLALVDAMIPTLVVVALTWFLLLGYDVGGVAGVWIGLVAGGATFGVTLVGSAINRSRGGSPFAFTRAAKYVLQFDLLWWHH